MTTKSGYDGAGSSDMREVESLAAEGDEAAGLALDAVSWQDEESRFVGCLGSRSFCGLLTPEMEAGARDRNGARAGGPRSAARTAHPALQQSRGGDSALVNHTS